MRGCCTAAYSHADTVICLELVGSGGVLTSYISPGCSCCAAGICLWGRALDGAAGV